MKYPHYREKMEKMGIREARVRLAEMVHGEKRANQARSAPLG